MLIDSAIGKGVQSTTRYRRSTTTPRNGSFASRRARGGVASRAHAGRRGGVCSSRGRAARNSHLGMTSHYPFHPTLLSQAPSYNYPIPMPTTSGELHNTTLPTPPSILPSSVPYSYGGYHDEASPSLSQPGTSPEISSLLNVTEAFPAPEIPAQTSSGYECLYANPEELVHSKSDFLGWNGSSHGDGSYHN